MANDRQTRKSPQLAETVDRDQPAQLF